MGKNTILIWFLLIVLFPCSSEASVIKVLILDDTFQQVPTKDERIDRIGRLSGDLLVSGTHYNGNIEVWKGKSGMYLINELPVEEYVQSVVAAEVSASWDMEALKAQAVIARTYALYQRMTAPDSRYDLTSSVMHQVYKGSNVDARIAYAVMNTQGEVLTYHGALVEALYHSTCGGETEDAREVFGKSYPYLRPVKSDCAISPYWTWEKEIPADDIERALGIVGIKAIAIKSYTSTGRVKSVEISCREGVLVVKATDLRRMLGWAVLPSTNFRVSRDGRTFFFEGKGYGHGVGLCQWSALEMAREGKDYRQILSFFYPGTVIRSYEDR